jgi:putative phosphoesterase
MKIGVISDTHGLLRPEAVEALRGTQYILHAGDVGDPSILQRLRQIAPVTAIRGNIDEGQTCDFLPPIELVELEGKTFYLLHSLQRLDLDPAAADIAAVLSGHSHRPSIEWRNGVLFMNPGSAGPRRFSLPVTVGVIDIDRGEMKAQILDLAL